VWVWESGKQLHCLSTDDRSANRVAFHPDGARLAATVSEDTIHIWDYVSGERLIVLRRAGDYLGALTFSADGNTLLASSANDIIRFETGPPDCGFTEREHYRRARALMEPFDVGASSQEIVAALREDTALPPAVRKGAEAQALARGDSPNDLNSKAWGQVRFAGRAASDYQDGLRMSAAACALWPDDWAMLNTLGVAHYRVGDFAAAARTFERCRVLRAAGGLEPHPADAAFEAMTYLRLGDVHRAMEDLRLARRLMGEPQFAGDEESRAFLREAEALIDHDASAGAPTGGPAVQD
jgi:tetratricopeptide (TPR) repeat protein